MNKKVYNNLKGWLVAFLVILLFLPTTKVNAGSVDSVATVMTGSAELARICNDCKTEFDVEILKYDSVNGVLSFSNAEYSELEYSEKKDFMEYALSSVKKSNLPSTQKNKIYNFIANQDEAVTNALKYLKNDTSADFVTAKKWFAPFSGPISSIMGFLCIIITVGLGFSIVFDVCYLVIPMTQIFLDRDDGKKPWGVSMEAWKAQKDVENSSTYKSSTIQIYLRKRIPVFIVVTIVLGWLLSGKIYDIIIYFVGAFN